MNPAGAAAGFSYASTQARLFMSKPLARRHATAQWLYRLTFNAAVEAERSFGAFRRRQVVLGREPPPRPGAFDQATMLASLRVDDGAGPAFAEASLFPAVMLRAAAREAHDATTASIRKWARGELASLPRFRPASEAQTIKLGAFKVTRDDGACSDAKRPTMAFVVKGLGKLKAKLSRPLPPGHAAVELHLARHPDGTAALRVVSRGPAATPALDPAAVGQAIHEAVRHLAEGAPNAAHGAPAPRRRGGRRLAVLRVKWLSSPVHPAHQLACASLPSRIAAASHAGACSPAAAAMPM